MLIAAHSKEKADETIEASDIKTIYYVNKVSENDTDLSMLNLLKEENYDAIDYKAVSSVDEAFEKAGADSAVLVFEPRTLDIKVDLIIPEASGIEKDKAKNYFDFIDKYEQNFVVLVSGISFRELSRLSIPGDYKTYDETGYKEGYTLDSQTEKNDDKAKDEVLEIFRFAMPYICIMFLYFLILMYGNGIAMSMVMEKESKLMDTMLISLKPEALAFGKLLGVILAGLLQIFAWIGGAVLGFFIGNKVTQSMFPDTHLGIVVFFKAIKELGIFKPVNVIFAVLFIVFGFALYASIAAIAGALSSNKEEVGSRNTIFVLPLLISFMALISMGGLEGNSPAAFYYIPFTAALVVPADLSLGLVSTTTMIISFVIMVVCTLFIVYCAGRIYKMTSLFKGNKVSIKDIGEALFTKSN